MPVFAKVGEQEFRIERMSREQGARYADIDRRITELRDGSGAATSTIGGA